MRHPERIPFRVVALVLPWAPSIDATHLLMAPMAFFQAETLKMRIATAKASPQNQLCAHPHIMTNNDRTRVQQKHQDQISKLNGTNQREINEYLQNVQEQQMREHHLLDAVHYQHPQPVHY